MAHHINRDNHPVELIKYLNTHFYTKQELLNITKISEHAFSTYQANNLMPQCSYKLNLTMQCDSFFGLHNENQAIEYYAKGYVSWLTLITTCESSDAVYVIFEQRYKKAIDVLRKQGHTSNHPKLSLNIDNHIKEEWTHFLAGIYGLCTQSGLPEDIAAKELSIIEINELNEMSDLTAEQLDKLKRAVNLLDAASSLFAPHERLRSSRHRLVDEIRREYKLSADGL